MEPTSARKLAKKLGLRLTAPEGLHIRRKRAGEGWAFFNGQGRRIRDRQLVARLNRLAVPPAYQDVFYASDPKAHLQAVGRDAAGRLQYRYHPDWEKIRDIRKAQRLAYFIEGLPRIRRIVASALKAGKPNRELALASVVALVDASSIRAGNEGYARERKTRGATTLLKSNVQCSGDVLTLSFRAKGGKQVHKEVRNARLCKALAVLRKLPGSRLFQFQSEDGAIRSLTSQDVNLYLKEIAACEDLTQGFPHALREFRCVGSARLRRSRFKRTWRKKQIKQALETAARSLENTATVCRKSYVHPAILTAFETGTLKPFADALKSARSSTRKEQAVAEIIVAAAAA